jgi:NAD(P)-dependent dehydrogenase (short-subunit alcohol dehydrogenase family)
MQESGGQLDFAGQVAIVTGGGTGLGKAIAVNLAKRGAKLVIASRSEEHLNEAAAEIRKFGEVLCIPTDVRDPIKVQSMVDGTIEKFGKIDILVNNAAGNFLVPSEKLTPNGWNAVTNIVLNGSWYCSSAAAKHMIAQKKGCILSIIATFAWTGAPGVVHSASAKAGVLAMTRSLAAEWGRYGIRVNALAPGVMLTEGASKNLKFDTKEGQEKLLRAIPLGRFATPEEIADLAIFLCSKTASYITGDVMTADGGAWLLGSKNFYELMPEEN